MFCFDKLLFLLLKVLRQDQYEEKRANKLQPHLLFRYVPHSVFVVGG